MTKPKKITNKERFLVSFLMQFEPLFRRKDGSFAYGRAIRWINKTDAVLTALRMIQDSK